MGDKIYLRILVATLMVLHAAIADEKHTVRMVRNMPERVNGVLGYDVMVASRDGPTSLLWQREVCNICTQNQPWRYECPCANIQLDKANTEDVAAILDEKAREQRLDDLIRDIAHTEPESDNSDTPDKRSNLFRFGKRNTLFRFGKRDSDYTNHDDKRYGNLFRYGKRQGSLLRYGKRVPTPIFRYGKRSPTPIFRYGKRSPIPIFRYGKRSSTPFFRYGKRSSTPFFRYGKRAATPIFRYGKRAATPIFRYGKRASTPTFRYGRTAPIFRYGKRSSLFRYGKRDSPFDDSYATINEDDAVVGNDLGPNLDFSTPYEDKTRAIHDAKWRHGRDENERVDLEGLHDQKWRIGRGEGGRVNSEGLHAAYHYGRGVNGQGDLVGLHEPFHVGRDVNGQGDLVGLHDQKSRYGREDDLLGKYRKQRELHQPPHIYGRDDPLV